MFKTSGDKKMANQELVPIFQELKRQRETRKDLIVDSRSLKAVAEPERMVIYVQEVRSHSLTQWVPGQWSALIRSEFPDD